MSPIVRPTVNQVSPFPPLSFTSFYFFFASSSATSAILVSYGSSTSGSTTTTTSSSHSSSSTDPNSQAETRLGVTQNTTPFTSNPESSIPFPVQVTMANEVDRWEGEYQDIGYPNGCLSVISKEELELAKTLISPNVKVQSLGNHNIFYPPEGYIGIRLTSIRFGFRLPVHPLLAAICRYHTHVPGQLTPNAHRLLSFFLTLCHAYGLEPSLSLSHPLLPVT